MIYIQFEIIIPRILLFHFLGQWGKFLEWSELHSGRASQRAEFPRQGRIYYPDARPRELHSL